MWRLLVTFILVTFILVTFISCDVYSCNVYTCDGWRIYIVIQWRDGELTNSHPVWSWPLILWHCTCDGWRIYMYYYVLTWRWIYESTPGMIILGKGFSCPYYDVIYIYIYWRLLWRDVYCVDFDVIRYSNPRISLTVVIPTHLFPVTCPYELTNFMLTRFSTLFRWTGEPKTYWMIGLISMLGLDLDFIMDPWFIVPAYGLCLGSDAIFCTLFCKRLMVVLLMHFCMIPVLVIDYWMDFQSFECI